MRRSLALGTTAAALATALAVLTGCGASGSPADASGDAGDAAEAGVPAESTVAPRPAPAPARTLSSPPEHGEVRVEEGPFTDRVDLGRLKLTDKPSVTGHLAITSDVSDVIALELRAAYYDADGRLLGTGSFSYEEEHGAEGGHGHGEHRAAGSGIDFTIPASKLKGSPAAAVVSVPVLVNE